MCAYVMRGNSYRALFYVGATQRTFALDCALWSDCVVYDRINISYFFLSTLTQ